METETNNETYDPQRLYRAPKGPMVGTMEIPNHLAVTSGKDAAAEDRDDLNHRQEMSSRLLARRKEAGNILREAERAYEDFQQLMRDYREADNAKNPTEPQQKVIQQLNSSVSTVVLTGQSTLDPLVRRMSTKAIQLRDARDVANKNWNEAYKVMKIPFYMF